VTVTAKNTGAPRVLPPSPGPSAATAPRRPAAETSRSGAPPPRTSRATGSPTTATHGCPSGIRPARNLVRRAPGPSGRTRGPADRRGRPDLTGAVRRPPAPTGADETAGAGADACPRPVPLARVAAGTVAPRALTRGPYRPTFIAAKG
jgi:hypothetical protein